MSSLLKAIRVVVPSGRPTSVVSVVRKQSDTVEQARAKVIEKLNTSIAYVEGGMIAKLRPIDLVFQPEAGGTFAVGARYGIRWLPNLFGDGEHMYQNVKRDEVLIALQAIVRAVQNGDCDSDLLLIQKQNAERMRKAA